MKQSSLLLQILALCLLFLFTETTANEATLAATREARLAATIAADAAARGAAPGVIELTTLKLDENIRDGSIWFIEFYAPWCHHCTAFAPSYARIAVKMHALQLSETTDSATTTKRPIKVAKINADQERACSSRFNVKGFPSFYLVDGWTAYQYEGKRNEEQIIAYIRGGYKSEDPLPIWSSPMGPLGQLQFLVFYVGSAFFSGYTYLVENKGYSPAMAATIFAFGSITVCLVTMITVAIVLSGKVKED